MNDDDELNGRNDDGGGDGGAKESGGWWRRIRATYRVSATRSIRIATSAMNHFVPPSMLSIIGCCSIGAICLRC